MPRPSTTRTHPAEPELGAAERARRLVDGQLRVLGRLAEAGLNVALEIERQAVGAADGQDDRQDASEGEGRGEGQDQPKAAARMTVGELGLAYARVSRAVRLTVALQSKLLKDLQALEEAAARHASWAGTVEGGERRKAREARKERVQRILWRVITAEQDDADAAEALAERADDRLELDEVYGDVLERPVSEIVAGICRDLGLDPDWGRLAGEAWAQDEIDSGAAGSPLAAFLGLGAPDLAGPDLGRGSGPPPPGPHAASP